MMIKKNHPYHLVDQSPWPILTSLSVMVLMAGLTTWFNNKSYFIFALGALCTTLSALQWWRDVTRESTMQGNHTFKVMKSMKWGMALFIVSEVLFFLSFFWAFFHSTLSPSTEVGMMWPPMGVNPFNPVQIPLLNTIILLSSGVTVTWAHHALTNNEMLKFKTALYLTILFGVYFSVLQGAEYSQAPFCISDSIYGASFFMATGFHGIHVLVGTSFLAVNLLRSSVGHFSKTHHFGFEAAAWYWHFVDVVWLFLYMSIYWWGT